VPRSEGGPGHYDLRVIAIMPDELRKPYLKQADRDFILEGLARNHRPQRIVNDLQLERGVTTTRQNVIGYSKRNPEIIQTLRSKFIDSLGNCALIEKAERIAELEKMYEKFLQNCAGNYSKENIEVLQGLIVQIQKEVEPLKIKGEGFESKNTTNVFTFGGEFSRELRQLDTTELRAFRDALRSRIAKKRESPVVLRDEVSSDN